jgi:hypothetical protein
VRGYVRSIQRLLQARPGLEVVCVCVGGGGGGWGGALKALNLPLTANSTLKALRPARRKPAGPRIVVGGACPPLLHPPTAFPGPLATPRLGPPPHSVTRSPPALPALPARSARRGSW